MHSVNFFIVINVNEKKLLFYYSTNMLILINSPLMNSNNSLIKYLPCVPHCIMSYRVHLTTPIIYAQIVPLFYI